MLMGLSPSMASAAPCPAQPASWVSAPRKARTSPFAAKHPRAGFALARTRPFTSFPETSAPTWLGPRDALTVMAAPIDHEPATFAIVAARTLRNVRVEVSDLVGPKARIASGAIAVREMRYGTVRKHLSGSEVEAAPRFLPRWEPATIRRGQFREVWLDIAVDAPPGIYRGKVTIHTQNGTQTRKLILRVRDVALAPEPDKSIGLHYTIATDDDAARRELADMRAHGVRHLVTSLRPRYLRRDDDIVVETDVVERGLDLIEDAGFEGTVVVESGFVHLGWLLGHNDVAFAKARGESLDGPSGAAFRTAAITGLEALQRLDARYPTLTVGVVHLDEIFNADRLELFLRFAKLTHDASSLPQYATLHTATPEAEALFPRVQPYVSLRGHHGYSFEWWLERGHTIDEYARELASTSTRAWYYHNDRGAFFRPVWARIVNGVWLWASPFEAHVPWTYQRFDGNPLDDTDCNWHDFGFSFPDPADPKALIPTLAWEATREGFDDLRYLTTLEREIAAGKARSDPAADTAEQFLLALRSELVAQLPTTDTASQRRRVGSQSEAPYVSRISRRLGAGGLVLTRERIAEHIHALQVASALAPRGANGG